MSMSSHVFKVSNIIVILVLEIEAHGPFLNIFLFYHNDDMTCTHKIYILFIWFMFLILYRHLWMAQLHFDAKYFWAFVGFIQPYH
jgi:hypothetical protein